MRVVMTALGSSGDVFPAVGLGARLRARGHEVIVVTNPHFEPLVQRAGLGFSPLGTEADYLAALANPAVWDSQRGFQAVLSTFLRFMEPLYDTLRGLYVPGGTVMVAHVLDFASRVLQERHGAPVATYVPSPAVIRSVHQVPVLLGTADFSRAPLWLKRAFWWLADWKFVDPVVLPGLNALRAREGLAPVRRPFDGWIFSPDLTVGLFPAWYAAPQPDWPPQVRLTSFPLFDLAEPVPLEVDQFLEAGEPPVVFTPGTAMAHGQAFFEAAVDVCQRLGRRGLLLSRFTDAPSLPGNMLHAPFAPLSSVLPRSAAVVHHGGIGTTAAGFVAGVPQVVMPMSHDQPDNAARVSRLGVGATLLPRRFRGDTLTGTLGRLLDSAVVAERCGAFADRLRGQDGLAEAATLTEELGERSAGVAGASAFSGGVR